MNLLVIGNGFDLAHGLKTTYDDFLGWAYENGEMGKYWGFDLNAYWKRYHTLKKERTVEIEDGVLVNHSPTSVGQEYHLPDYVETLFKKQNDTWIDLENNLASVINKCSAKWFKRSSGFAYEEFKSLFDDFIVAMFEKYIASVVNVVELQQILSVGNADLVLSFNYSNTYERLYKTKRNTPICYINGQASDDKYSSNIVFGCDCYSAEYRELSWYDKTSQRHEKNSDCRYKDWLKWNEKNPLSIFIVGHSLGRTDYDILRHFVMNRINRTYVYYHCPNAKTDLIYNMIGMVGREHINVNHIDFLPIAELNIPKSNYAKTREQQRKKRGVISSGVTV